MDNEHDDDLPSTVETRDEMEIDDYPNTVAELEGDEPLDEPEGSDDDDVEDIIGK